MEILLYNKSHMKANIPEIFKLWGEVDHKLFRANAELPEVDIKV